MDRQPHLPIPPMPRATGPNFTQYITFENEAQMRLTNYLLMHCKRRRRITSHQISMRLWSVFRAKDYLPKLTVVYFLRVRRGTSPHQTRETNAGGGGVRRHTRRVKPTPEEEGYVATPDA